MANKRERPPADNVPIEVGVRRIASTEDTPVAAPCDVVRFPNLDRDRVGWRCFIILNPEDHRVSSCGANLARYQSCIMALSRPKMPASPS